MNAEQEAREPDYTEAELGAMPFMQIYGQERWHDDTMIAGTRGAIEALRKACDEALAHGEAAFDAFSSDGEGYKAVVRVTPSFAALHEMPSHYFYQFVCSEADLAHVRQQAERAALEKAAKVCDAESARCTHSVQGMAMDVCAAAIRELKNPTTKATDGNEQKP